ELSSPNPADGPFLLRWGNREPPDADKVPFPPRWLIDGDPCCFKAGATLRLSLKQDAPDPNYGWIVRWGVGYLTLVSNVTGEVLMFYPDSPDLPANQPYDFGPLVEWIEYASLELAVYVEFEKGIGFDDFHGFVDEIFIVLDKPKPPMDPAWVNVLRISCVWARGAKTWKIAADMLRNGVFNNCQYEGFILFHHFEGWQDTEIGRETTEETFHLKAFLSQPEPRMGNCNALTNFLCCLITSVGINAIVQRTNRVILENGNKVGRWTFRTKLIRPANWLKDGYGQWGYHQFVLIEIEGNQVWDGNFIFKDPLA
ncbi:MAG: hypothetical protein RMK94_17050, partial [Armatimonadota bacterium]|nr:hypothetical protein [Armatimonadota bacterium]